MAVQKGFLDQVRGNLVAIISVFIAVSSLSYNTWRNELTEYNRNQRNASFELLLQLGELQELVFYRHYDRDADDKGNPRTGWALALTIRDLAQVIEEPVPATAEQLVETWDGNWSRLGEDQASADAILDAIEAVRLETLSVLQNLD